MAASPSVRRRPHRLRGSIGPSWLLALAVVVFALTAPQWLPPYWLQVAVLSVIASIFAMSLNLLMGYTGLDSLGQAAFYGLASYGVGIMTAKHGVSWGIAAPVALLVTAAAAAGFGALAVRLRGLYFLLITLAFGEVLWGVANQWANITGGADGLGGIPMPFPALVNPKDFFYFAFGLCVLVFLVVLLIIKSPFGLGLVGIRERELRSTTLGYNTYFHKWIVFVIAGVIAGVAGLLSAAWNGFASTGDVSLTNSFAVMLMVIVGGTGTIAGPIVGAVTVTLLQYALSAYVVNYWLMILGVIYVAVTLWLREGIVGFLLVAPSLAAKRLGRPRRSPTWTRAAAPAEPEPDDVLGEVSPASAVAGPGVDLRTTLAPLFAGSEASATGRDDGLLALDGIAKSFRDVQVLADVSLRVAAGERVGIIGLNGAGKTTLFQVLTGIEAPSKGRIAMAGRDVTALPANRRNGLGLARTFQVTNLYARLSARENVILALLGRRHRRHQYAFWRPLRTLPVLHERALDLLDGVGLARELADVEVRHLSYGHQRQVEIALALASGPSLLLLDEPTAGLAQTESAVVVRLLEAMPERLTLLIVEHNLEVIFQAVDRIVVLHQGRIIKDAPAEAIRRDPEVKKLYFGSHVPGGDASKGTGTAAGDAHGA